MLSRDSSYIGLNSSHAQDYSNALLCIRSLPKYINVAVLRSVKKGKVVQSCVMWAKLCKVAQNNIPHGIFFVFYRFFTKDLAIYISQWFFVPSRLVLVVVFCCLVIQLYSYKNRTKEIKHKNKWLIDLHHHQQQQQKQQQTFLLDSF